VRNYNDLVKLAERAARRAAEYIRSAARPAADTWTEKAQHDFVTDVDRTSENLITEVLMQQFPESVVIGEELSPGRVPPGKIVWIVDPLDGTTNFLHGYPQYAVSIGCAVDGVVGAGVIHDVSRNVTFRAALGGGAWMDDARITVSTVTEPKRALIATGFPFRELSALDRYLRRFAAVTRGVSGIRRAGSAALDLADVAAGRFEAFWEIGLAPWDIAAGIVLIREAGGNITRLDGSDDVLNHGEVVAGNRAMHEWILSLLGTVA
jgi:myo-inositol-1(or 4)-monophosphatase